MTDENCLLCKIPLPAERGNRRLYCSPICRYDHRRIRDQGYKNPEMVVKLRKLTNRCQICGNEEKSVTRHGKDKMRLLSIDHDHETGMIRGIICSNCNRAIGLMGDSVELLRKAALYLEVKHATRQTSIRIS